MSCRRLLTEIDWMDIDSDLLAGETPRNVLAERHDISERTLHRRCAMLREQGRTVRTAEPLERGGRRHAW